MLRLVVRVRLLRPAEAFDFATALLRLKSHFEAPAITTRGRSVREPSWVRR